MCILLSLSTACDACLTSRHQPGGRGTRRRVSGRRAMPDRSCPRMARSGMDLAGSRTRSRRVPQWVGFRPLHGWGAHRSFWGIPASGEEARLRCRHGFTATANTRTRPFEAIRQSRSPPIRHQSATLRWVRAPPNRYRTATEVTPLAASVEVGIALLREPDYPVLERRNRMSLASDRAVDRRRMSEKPWETATKALPLRYPADRGLGSSAHFAGDTERVVTNQPLYQLSYAGSMSDSTRTAHNMIVRRPTPRPATHSILPGLAV
jgi:hypothetical protein